MYAKNKGEHLPRKLLLEVKTDAGNLEKLKALRRFSPVFDMTSHGTNTHVNIERKLNRRKRLKEWTAGGVGGWMMARAGRSFGNGVGRFPEQTRP
ncbi:hypothetical protein PJI16_09730 [Nitrospira sp. MA-1]|nr:hypothetical protein [Nitrospira sp. MA-1]